MLLRPVRFVRAGGVLQSGHRRGTISAAQTGVHARSPTTGASDYYGIRESFARFDRLQVVARRNLDRPQVRLTLNALTVLQDLLIYYLTGVPEQNIEDVRRDYMKAKGLA